MIVNQGIQKVAELLSGETWQIAVGTGTTPEWVDNETLEQEYGRWDASASLITSKIENDTIRFHLEHIFEEEKDITEYGIIHKNSAIMIDRKTRTKVTVKPAYTLLVDFDLQIKGT